MIPVSPGNHIRLFDRVLKRAKLEYDRENNPLPGACPPGNARSV
jgi:hypothetical protein